jgi:uncharacterized phage protein (TIGR02216 family)
MALGLGALKLSPGTFWALTPREFDAALEGHFGRGRRTALGRGDLDALMAAFPDIAIEEPTEDADYPASRVS